MALALKPEFHDDPNAMAWLWKDHTAHAEAEKITEIAGKIRKKYLAKCGGRYSSEWFWAKLWKASKVSKSVWKAAYTWVEISDWIPAILSGTTHPDKLVRDVCAAGHKAFFNDAWGGYPDAKFLAALSKDLLKVKLPKNAANISKAVGGLTEEWAKKLGLPAGIPIAVGAFDAHLGAVGAGVGPGTLVKIMGTSTCDIMVSPMKKKLADVPGLCGIVPESVLPEFYGLEAGQSAVGDIFNWFINYVQPTGETHVTLNEKALKIAPGSSGLLGLDWHNGNRTVLTDQRLTGMILGLTLQSSPAEIYRTLIESTAYGARVIMERFEEYGVPVKRVVNCGGIAARSPLTMQIYADVMNRPLCISRSTQTCALGAAIAAAVAAGKSRGGYANFASAIKNMTGVQETIYKPIAKNVKVYEKLFQLYRQLHDAFGVKKTKLDLSMVMKDLLAIREQTRA
jgi:L-ribulokinase